MRRLAKLQAEFFQEMVFGAESKSVGMAVYQNGYKIRFQDALENDFSESFKVLPTDKKKILLQDFFASTLSDSYTLNTLGRKWVDFTAKHPLAKNPAPYAELFAFEWELIELGFRDSEPKAKKKLFRLLEGSPVGIELALGLSARHYHYPVQRMFEEEVLLPPEETRLLFWHIDGDGDYTEVDTFTFDFLCELLQETTWSSVEKNLQVRGWKLDAQADKLQLAMQELAALGVLRLVSL